MSVMRLHHNHFAHRRPATAAEQRIVSLQSSAEARAEIRQWAGYSPTPLYSLTPFARRFGVSEVLYKDEATRFSLGSFKALGGAYAAAREVQRMLRERAGVDVSLRALFSGACASEAAAITLCCATDGNHGVSVAYAAKSMGCGCVVFMHEHASRSRESHMLRLGAAVRRTPGTYDDSVRIARDAVRDFGWVLIADTSTGAFEQVPAEVIQGYTVMLLEILEQHAGPPPTHVFLQGGVGGLAAAGAGFLAERFGEHRPTLIVVEPDTAACLLASARQGRAARIEGDLDTVMGMLSCGEASPIAWTILKERCDAFMTINDQAAQDAHDLLCCGEAGRPLSVGYSGAAGVAGFMELMRCPDEAPALRLNRDSRVLVFGTETGGGDIETCGPDRSPSMDAGVKEHS
jgi:diaminopropionate ammonia-lyase